MLEIYFKPAFVRMVNKLDADLREEVVEKISLFKNVKNHKHLKVHKLHGRLSSYFGFSVNYKIRIIFRYESKNEVILVDIDDHDVYK